MLRTGYRIKNFFYKNRKAVFILIPALIFFGLSSIILSNLEKRETIQTERPDDRVTYIPGDFLKEIKTPKGMMYVIDEPDMIPAKFAKRKPESTFRIIMTGGSFAMGSPYVFQKRKWPTHGGIPDWILGELTFMYPSKKIEVINAAAGAQNSDRVEKIVDRLAPTKPDLMIVAMGNNEGYVPSSKMNEALHKWIFYRVMKKSMLKSPKLRDRPYFALQDENPDKIEMNFRKNLERIIEHCKRSDTPLMLCTLPINLKYESPSEANGSNVLKKDDPLFKGKKFFQDGKYEQAKKFLVQSKSIGLASYYLAKIEEFYENYELARSLYGIYAQNVPLNRARPSFNNHIRQYSEQKGVMLADLEKSLEQLSPHRITVSSFFVDYCHMTLKGYYLMGEVVVKQISKYKLIQGNKGEPKRVPDGYEIIRSLKWDMYQIGFSDEDLKNIFEVKTKYP